MRLCVKVCWDALLDRRRLWPRDVAGVGEAVLATLVDDDMLDAFVGDRERGEANDAEEAAWGGSNVHGGEMVLMPLFRCDAR